MGREGGGTPCMCLGRSLKLWSQRRSAAKLVDRVSRDQGWCGHACKHALERVFQRQRRGGGQLRSLDKLIGFKSTQRQSSSRPWHAAAGPCMRFALLLPVMNSTDVLVGMRAELVHHVARQTKHKTVMFLSLSGAFGTRSALVGLQLICDSRVGGVTVDA